MILFYGLQCRIFDVIQIISHINSSNRMDFSKNELLKILRKNPFYTIIVEFRFLILKNIIERAMGFDLLLDT